MRTILKLGGSVITDKQNPETVDQDRLDAVVETVSDWLTPASDLVVVHGGGSFGHQAANKYELSREMGTRDVAALVAVHRAMTRLNDYVIDACHELDVGAVPVRPFSLCTRQSRPGESTVRGEISITCPTEPVETMLEEELVPVLHGDIVVHEGVGGSILSGDELVVALGAALDADRIGVCSTVPGVLDADGNVIPEITSYDAVRAVLEGSEVTDVTGGMAGKVDTLLAFDGPAALFGPAELETFLETGTAGTAIR